MAPVSASSEQSPGAVLHETGPEPVGLTLDQVQRRWPEIIGAVQALNKTTAAVLRSNCQPVDLAGDQIVVTVPSAILRDKLDNPQRKVEVQEAVSSVLGVQSRIRLVLEAEYASRTPRPAPERSESRSVSGVDGMPAERTSEANGRSASGADDDQVPDEISRWAAERGGLATIVKDSSPPSE